MLRGISTSWLNTMVSQQAFADDYLSNHLAERMLSPSIMIKHPRNFPITTSRTIPRRKSCHRQDCHTQLCFKHHGDSTTFCDDLSNYLAGRMLSQSIMIKHHGNSTTFCDDLSNYLAERMLSQSIMIKHHGNSTTFLWWPFKLSRRENVVTEHHD